jgi:hypothetical protein
MSSTTYLDVLLSSNVCLCQVDESLINAGGVSSLRINGAIHHRMGRLLPNDPDGAAQFAQIYVLDNAEDQLNRRMNIMPNLSNNIMRNLTAELQQHNAFARAFHVASLQLANMGATTDLVFTIKGHAAGIDSRRFNAPVATEMAAWIPDGADPAKGCRDIRLFARSGEVRHISELHPAYMALHFPLLFPLGESGWHPHIPFRSGMSAAATFEDVQQVLAAPATSLALFNAQDSSIIDSIPPDEGHPDDCVPMNDDEANEPVVSSQRERNCTLLRYANYHLRRRQTGNFSILHAGRYVDYHMQLSSCISCGWHQLFVMVHLPQCVFTDLPKNSFSTCTVLWSRSGYGS